MRLPACLSLESLGAILFCCLFVCLYDAIVFVMHSALSMRFHVIKYDNGRFSVRDNLLDVNSINDSVSLKWNFSPTAVELQLSCPFCKPWQRRFIQLLKNEWMEQMNFFKTTFLHFLIFLNLNFVKCYIELTITYIDPHENWLLNKINLEKKFQQKLR